MKSIKSVIYESNKDADQTFVYVALKIGRVLISNDMGDIVRGRGEAQTWRRDRLLRDTEGRDLKEPIYLPLRKRMV
jgi:hypothetical protein